MIHTPIDQISEDIWVKREDLSCLPPGPPFAKIRGLEAFLKKNTDKVIGYVETQISMAGWGTAFLCKKMNIPAVIFYPDYKTPAITSERLVLEFHKERWSEFGARLVPVKAGRLKILHYMAVRQMKEEYEDKALTLPLYLPLPETADEVAKELEATFPLDKFKSVVMCVGSGVMIAGVLRGLSMIGLDIPVYGVFIRHHDDIDKKREEIIRRSNVMFGGGNFKLINTDYEYLQSLDTIAPFNCNPYYDIKAWKWLIDHIKDIETPVLFWNIGADGMK
jgi:1-aminocyclopropane-1-carboxylate deaminase/D-cysteine desulfhydrase-like pyridoxal-dependent ACC family enzyme